MFDKMRQMLSQIHSELGEPEDHASEFAAEIGPVQVAGQDYPLDIDPLVVSSPQQMTLDPMTVPVQRQVKANVGPVSIVQPGARDKQPKAEVGPVQIAGQDYPLDIDPLNRGQMIEGVTVPVPRQTKASVGPVTVVKSDAPPRTMSIQKAIELLGEEDFEKHYPGIFGPMGHLPYTTLGRKGELEVRHPADVMRGENPILNDTEPKRPKLAGDE